MNGAADGIMDEHCMKTSSDGRRIKKGVHSLFIHRNLSEIFFHATAIAIVMLGLYFSSLYSYLLFHSLIEIVIVACLAMGMP